MTNNQQALIQYVIKNDLKNARLYAKFILESNKTKADEKFCTYWLQVLKEQETKGLEIPLNLNGILLTECGAYPFREERYFLTEREAGALQHIQKMNIAATEMEEKYQMRYSNSVLLFGESGTGKTTFARYIASRLNIPFLYANMTQMMSSLLGKTGQNMEQVFRFASSQSCVLVLDEIDVVGTSRNFDSGVDGEMKRVLVSIMQNLDALPNKTILIGATNRPDALDAALARRFTQKHEVLPLSYDESLAFIAHYATKIGLPSIAENWTLEEGEKYTPAFLFAQIGERVAEEIIKNSVQ